MTLNYLPNSVKNQAEFLSFIVSISDINQSHQTQGWSTHPSVCSLKTPRNPVKLLTVTWPARSRCDWLPVKSDFHNNLRSVLIRAEACLSCECLIVEKISLHQRLSNNGFNVARRLI